MAGNNPGSRANSGPIGTPGGVDPRLFDAAVGNAFSSSFLCTTALQRLPSNPCRFVYLSNWNAAVTAGAPPAYDALSIDDLYENSGFELYYGFRGVAGHQLFPSQSSPFFPISNTDLISVRVREGAASRHIWFSWFY